jgi:hypothetical protein
MVSEIQDGTCDEKSDDKHDGKEMIDTMGTYMHGVHQMGAAATDVMISLSIALVFQLVILSYFAYAAYKIYKAWK